MGRWLIGLLLGLAALGAVFFLWQRESAHKAEIPVEPESAPMAMDGHSPTAPEPASPGTAEAPASGEAAAPVPDNPTASAEGIIVIDEPWARAAAANGNSAVYMLLTNTSQTADRLIAVSSPDAAEAAVHDTKIDSRNIATMRPASHVDLDPGVPLALEPGGLHVMLTGLKHPIKDRDQVTLVLTFQHAGTLTVKVPVGELAADGDSVQP
jgi:copper(I)-binding protein